MIPGRGWPYTIEHSLDDEVGNLACDRRLAETVRTCRSQEIGSQER